ncbi:GNAT family N-acetyltransferase [Paenibacillus sp. GCM10027627]|uniref:GNAT family N-acetyltransferase n=1 Tax=unclassified Paenibacillus TaxID=185978 RepID=UPI00363FE127
MEFFRTDNDGHIAKAKRLLYTQLFKPIHPSAVRQLRQEEYGAEHYFVCSLDQEIIAVMVLTVEGDGAELHHAITDKKYRSRGVGKRLWEQVRQFAEGEGFCSVELYSRNTAIEFWQSIGFYPLTEEWLEIEPFLRHSIRHKKMAIQFTPICESGEPG